MAFVGDQFLFDVFISYSHGDPKGVGESNFKQWSYCFWKELEREFEAHDDLAGLNIFFDSNPRIDEALDPFQNLDNQLAKNAKGSAVFLPLISHFYLKSVYCNGELRSWQEAQVAALLDTSGRLAPVLIWGKPPGTKPKWQEALQDLGMPQLMGIAFYDEAVSKDFPQPFGWPAAGEKIVDPRFFEALQKVVGFLRINLLKFKENIQERTALCTADPTQKPSIYLHGRSDAAKLWDKAYKALDAKGHAVFPEEPEPVEIDNAMRKSVRDKRIATMATCDALLMMAPEDPSIYAEELMVLGKADRCLAISRAEERLGVKNKRLPGAVVDVIDKAKHPDRANKRASQARATKLDWFSLSDADWLSQASKWLQVPP